MIVGNLRSFHQALSSPNPEDIKKAGEYLSRLEEIHRMNDDPRIRAGLQRRRAELRDAYLRLKESLSKGAGRRSEEVIFDREIRRLNDLLQEE